MERTTAGAPGAFLARTAVPGGGAARGGSGRPEEAYDVREIVARIADGSEFLDFKNEFDGQTVCGHLRIEGHACGLIGNNGPITPQGAAKAAQFIQLCEQSNTPLLFLHNTTGFMVGTESERQGVIKHGSKMIQAVANARVPKLTLVVGGSYGAGNYAMCGRGLDPRFIFAWPNSRTAVMGGAQAGKVLRIVTEEKHAKEGKEADPKMLEMLEPSPRRSSTASPPRSTAPPACGTTAWSTRATAAGCSATCWISARKPRRGR
ncbi:putative biotin-dependent carboxylase [Pseudomonas aeruginosa]|nr:putative biotin-dependent carboxylase [Pseudomonas aeruginosa]